MFNTPWDSQTPLFCTVDIVVLWEKSHEAIVSDLKEGLAFNTKEGDCPKLLNLLPFPPWESILPLRTFTAAVSSLFSR